MLKNRFLFDIENRIPQAKLCSFFYLNRLDFNYVCIFSIELTVSEKKEGTCTLRGFHRSWEKAKMFKEIV